MAGLNRKVYTSLRKKASASREFKNSVGKASSDIGNSLIPKESQRQAKPDSGAAYQKMLDKAQANYDKKLSKMQEQYQGDIARSTKDSNAAIKGLQEKIAAGDKRMGQMAESTQKALQGIGRQQPQNKTKQNTLATNTEEDDTSFDGTQGFKQDIMATMLSEAERKINEKADEDRSKSEGIEVTKPVIESLFSNVGLSKLSIPDNLGGFKKKNYDFGEYQMRFTDPFGIRNWGARKGKHSKGIDLRLFKDNKPVDYPVALADGKIVKIGMDGDGSRITPKQGASGGVYVYIQLDENPNKIYKMVHLPKKFYADKEKYMGKSVKRGDILIKDSLATGSMTAPHVKYAIADYDPNTGKSAMNYSSQENDPTKLFFTGSMNN